MIFSKVLGIVFSTSLILGMDLLVHAQIDEVDLENKHHFNTKLAQNNRFAQTVEPIFGFVRLAGADEIGVTITNQDKSLACSLQTWQLIGVFRNNQIQKTKGELTFKITNKSLTSQQFVLAELLFLNDLDMPLVVSNPHRKLQGEFIKLEPPLKPKETREYTKTIWYKSNWHKVQLKTCRWLERGSDYWQIYPELKPKSKK